MPQNFHIFCQWFVRCPEAQRNLAEFPRSLSVSRFPSLYFTILQASAAFLKGGDVKAAVDCCVLLNQWDEAVRLAQEHQFPQVCALCIISISLVHSTSFF